MICNLINIYKLCTKNNIRYSFYSESSHYQKYFYNFILLLDKKGKKIIYLSSDKKDKIYLKNVKNIYIGSGLLRFLLFLLIKTELFFLTVTDLNNNILKKNKFVNKYIYVFHAAVSMHKTYTKSAFDNYDSILTVGKYHNDELLNIEQNNNLKKKDLINSGYFYFDFLLENANFEKVENYILIAPSWNKSKKNFLNNECEVLIEYLLKKNFNLIFRPHPEHFKRNKVLLNIIREKFEKYTNFNFDTNKNNLESLEKSFCLITDNSGIAIEYTMVFKRPVIYFDKFPKIHNDDFEMINLDTFENKVKKKFGYKYNLENLNNFEKKLNEINKEFIHKKKDIDNFINENFFNFGKSSKVVLNYFEKDN